MLKKTKIFFLLIFVYLLCSSVSHAALDPTGAGWWGAKITSPFDPYRLHPTYNYVRPHQGMDISTPDDMTGVKIPAIADGTVIFNGWQNGYGHRIEIRITESGQYNGNVYSYNHLHVAPALGIGKTVKKGEYIALAGNSGVGTGAHLHLELLIHGVHYNPYNFAIDQGWSLTGYSGGYEHGNTGKLFDFTKYFDFTEFFDTALDITLHMNTLIVSIVEATVYLQLPLLSLLVAIILIDLINSFLFKLNLSEDMLRQLIKRMITYSFIVFFISFSGEIFNIIKDTVFDLGNIAMNTTDSEKIIVDPTVILKKVGFLLKNYLTQNPFEAFLLNLAAKFTPSPLLMLTQFLMGTMVIACLYIVFFMYYNLFFFYLTCLFSLVALPFQAFSMTRKATKGVFFALVTASFNLLILTFVFNLIFITVDNMTEVAISLSAILYFWLAIIGITFFLAKITSTANKVFGGIS